MIMLHYKKKIHALFRSIGKNNHRDMETMVTEDSISLLLHGAVNLCSLVQVSALNQLNSLNTSSIHFRISISYDVHKHELLLTAIYSDLVENGQLKEGTIIKITQCSCNIVRNNVHLISSSFFSQSVSHCSCIQCLSPIHV